MFSWIRHRIPEADFRPDWPNDIPHIRSSLVKVEQTAARLLDLLPSLARTLALDMPSTPRECLALVHLLDRVPRDVEGLRDQWLDAQQRQRILPVAREILGRVTNIQDMSAPLLKQYSPEILELAHDDLMQSLEAGVLQRLFSSQARATKAGFACWFGMDRGHRAMSWRWHWQMPRRSNVNVSGFLRSPTQPTMRSVGVPTNWITSIQTYGREDIESLERLDRLAVDCPTLNANAGIGACS